MIQITTEKAKRLCDSCGVEIPEERKVCEKCEEMLSNSPDDCEECALRHSFGDFDEVHESKAMQEDAAAFLMARFNKIT